MSTSSRTASQASPSAFRQTRSGHAFSPWEGRVIQVSGANLDALVCEAFVRESLADANDDIPKYLNAMGSPLLSSEAASPLPSSPTPSLPELEPTDSSPASLPSEASFDANHSLQPVEKLRRKKQGNKRRALRRAMEKDAAEHGDYSLKPALVNKHIRPAKKINTSLNASKLRHAKTAYVGIAGETGHKVYQLEELIGKSSRFKFKLVRWDGRTAIPITDECDRIAALLAGRPDDPTFEDSHRAASNDMEEARSKMQLPKSAASHRRGKFHAEAVGTTLGPGATHPTQTISHYAINAAIMMSLLLNPHIIRLAGFASAVFAAWNPMLYQYYVSHSRSLYNRYSNLRHNFSNSIFACATFNFGPQSCCFKHVDPANLPFGWCAITALGFFDPTQGGHLVLWDLKLVIEFPPGSTILIPSASLYHSNTAIQPGERRYSFTQYTSGGLFRWVDQGFQTSEQYLKSLSAEQRVAEEMKSQERWKMGISLLSTLGSLQQPPNFNKVG